MKLSTVPLWVLIMGLAFAAGAQENAAPDRQLRKTPPPCLPGTPACAKYKHRLTYPAHALSFGNAPFVLHPRGVNWPSNTGAMSLTLRRPLDYAGGKVRLTLFHQILDDSAGDLRFNITRVTLNHGNSFETYGGESTNTVAAPENPTILLQQTAIIEPGNGWNPNGDWWYLEITRGGSFAGGLRLMSVAVDY